MSRQTRLRRRLERIRASVDWVTEDIWFYNLDNYRSDRQVELELQALADTGVKLIALCEVIGNKLPRLAGYTLVQDRSTRSRLNIALYVHDSLPLRGHRWIDLEGTWPRTKGKGVHEARSYLVVRIGRMQLIVAHQPPKNARHARVLQQEGIDALARAMTPWRRKRSKLVRAYGRRVPRLLVWDANRKSGEFGPGPDALAREIDGSVHGGERIDSALTRGDIKVVVVHKTGRVRGTKLRSDHRGAIRVRFRVRAFWLK